MILVTGGTGFVGQRLVRALVARRRPTRILTRAIGPPTAFPTDVDVAVGNLLEAPTLDAALDGVTAIIHLAASMSRKVLAADLFRTNVEGTRRLARAARAHDATAFIHASSAGIYGDGTDEIPHSEEATPAPGTNYERSKLESEMALLATLKDSNVRTVILRPAGVHGPGRPDTLEFYRLVRRKTVWVHGPAHVVVHPTHVDDVVQAILLVLDRRDIGGQTFNIGGERALPYPELIDIVAHALGRRVTQVTPFPRLVRAGAQLWERWGRVIGLEPRPLVSRLARPIVNRAVDTTKARRLLGFQPMPLETGVQETVDWFRREGSL
jgi:nucleoside-diphosphate-sugar epimerase